ncbi:sensor histidine kinase [Haloarcula laminariae]|uniref:sensor histidine kinase n=1 Tax=Haloarcula laminariae TaxID=2961577 RepID=UPI002405B92E|nr:histidine kinase N-terminal 7TM domain-containing protein [Halomicroarcula sp. FL173]
MHADVVGILVAGSAAGALVSGTLAASAWRDRSIPGAGPFAWLMVAAVGWCLLNIAWLTASDPAVAAVVFPLTRFTSGLIIGLWVVFALSYTGREAWLTPARLAGLLLAPSLYGLLALSNPVHGLVTAGVIRHTETGLTLFIGETGVVYVAQMALHFGFIAAGYLLFGEFLLRSRNLYRKQTFVILTAGLLTAGVHGLFVLGATPHPGIDVTPLTFALNGVLVGVALLRYDFVSVAPLAGDLLVDELPDPVLALDTEGRIIDYNAAAASLLGTDELGGRPVDDVSEGLLDDVERNEVFALGDPLSYYDPQTSDITDQHGGVRGRLVVLREVTGQQRRQDRLEALQAATRQFIEADQPERVAELTVSFATRVLDQNAAAVFLATDDGRLEPAAVSDIIEGTASDLTICPETMSDHNVWRTFDSGEQRIADCEGCGGSMERALMVPMGEHGVLAIASADDSYPTEDQQYARILAQTTQVALEQVQRQRELRGSRNSVKRRNDQIEFFNGALRHSIRNGMLVVQGRADYLRDSVDSGDEHHIDSITKWCERLNDMSDAIKDINETVTASESEQLEPISLSAAMQAAVESAVEDSGVTVDMAIDDERVLANHLAEEVIGSIVENAVEHNTSDRPHVEIDTRDAGDWIQVRVADNGPGISDELKTRMFERSISNDQTAGGFGLYFVSVMMDLYGGKVWYEDNDPHGAVAILEFQRAEAASSPDTAGADVPALETQSKSHNG